MTIGEMVYAVNIELRPLEMLRRSLFITLDYNFLFNESMNEFIANAYKVYDRTELEKKILAPLVANYAEDISPSNSLLNNLPNGYTVNLPDDLLFVLEEHVARYTMVIDPTSNNQDVSSSTLIPTTLISLITVKPVTYDSYLVDRENPFKCPYNKLYWRLDFGSGKHELITDGVSLRTADYHSYYKVRYIAKPEAIDVNYGAEKECQLSTIFHSVIVTMVAAKAKNIIKAAQVMSATNKEKEEGSEEDGQRK